MYYFQHYPDNHAHRPGLVIAASDFYLSFKLVLVIEFNWSKQFYTDN